MPATTTPTTTTGSGVAARWVYGVALLPTVALSAMTIGWLVSAWLVPGHRPPPEPTAAAAAHQWAPWRAEPLRQQARNAAASGDETTAVQRYRQALTHSPSNAYLWAELASVLAQRLDDPDAFVQAFNASTHWAPNSRAIRHHNALLSERLWFRAPDRIESTLRSQFVDALRLDADSIQRTLFETGRSIHGCVAFGDLTAFQDWCARSAQWLQQCQRGQRHPKARPRCPAEYR